MHLVLILNLDINRRKLTVIYFIVFHFTLLSFLIFLTCTFSKMACSSRQSAWGADEMGDRLGHLHQCEKYLVNPQVSLIFEARTWPWTGRRLPLLKCWTNRTWASAAQWYDACFCKTASSSVQPSSFRIRTGTTVQLFFFNYRTGAEILKTTASSKRSNPSRLACNRTKAITTDQASEDEDM